MVDGAAGRPWRRRRRPRRGGAAAAGGVAARRLARASPSVSGALRTAGGAAIRSISVVPNSGGSAAAAGRRWRWGLHGAPSGSLHPLAARRCWLRWRSAGRRRSPDGPQRLRERRCGLAAAALAGGRAAPRAVRCPPASGACLRFGRVPRRGRPRPRERRLLRVPSGGGAGGGGGAGRGGSESLVLGSKGGGRALEDIKFSPGTTAASGGLLACAGHERIIEVHRVIADARAPGGVRLSPVAVPRPLGHRDASGLVERRVTAHVQLHGQGGTLLDGGDRQAAACRPRRRRCHVGVLHLPAWLPSHGHLAGRR